MLVFSVYVFALNILLVRGLRGEGELCPAPELEFCEEVAENLMSPTANQLVIFRENNPEPVGSLTTLAGKQIEVGAGGEFLNGIDGSILRSDSLETIQHFTRELKPPRVVGGKGAGAFGNFEVTEDVSDVLASVDAFNGIGKVTEVVVRFSGLAAGPGASDTLRTLRGMAVKFKDQIGGNFDILTINVPVFAVKDPQKIASFVRAQLRNPQTHRPDMTSFVDFVTKNPETTNHFIRIYSYLGIPCGYQNMAGYTAQTLAACDKSGNNRFVRLRFQPAEVKGLSDDDAVRLAGESPDLFIKSLYDQIAAKDYPKWTLSVQSLTQFDVDNADINVFDSTFVLPEEKYPYRVIGILTLTDNPENYFRDIEQTAFGAPNLPRGLRGVPGDKLFEVQPFVYRDAQNHRIGVNHDRIVVNRPKSPVFTYDRDGAAPVGPNGGNSPNYFPNSFNGPVPVAIPKCPELNFTVVYDPNVNNFGQFSDFYQSLSCAEQDRVANTIVRTLALVTAEDVVKAARKLIKKLDMDLSAKVEKQLNALDKICPVPPRKMSSTNALVERLQTIFKITP